MKRFLQAVAFATVLFCAGSVHAANTWETRVPLTISASLVDGTTDLTNFPLYLEFNESLMAACRNTPNTCIDLRFTLDEHGFQKVDHHIINGEAETSGYVAVEIEIPTLNAESTTVIYMWIGSDTCVNQSNSGATYHNGSSDTLLFSADCGDRLEEDTTGDALLDSTHRGNNLTDDATNVVRSTDDVHGHFSREFTTTYQHFHDTDIDLDCGGELTVSYWANFTDGSANAWKGVINYKDDVTATEKWETHFNDFNNYITFSYNTTAYEVDLDSIGTCTEDSLKGCDNSDDCTGTCTSLSFDPFSAFHHYVWTVTNSTTIALYIDGVDHTLSLSSGSPVAVTYAGDEKFYIGRGDTGFPAGKYMQGEIDGIKIYKEEKSHEWILADYRMHTGNHMAGSSHDYVTYGAEYDLCFAKNSNGTCETDYAYEGLWHEVLFPNDVYMNSMYSSDDGTPDITSRVTSDGLSKPYIMYLLDGEGTPNFITNGVEPGWFVVNATDESTIGDNAKATITSCESETKCYVDNFFSGSNTGPFYEGCPDLGGDEPDTCSDPDGDVYELYDLNPDGDTYFGDNDSSTYVWATEETGDEDEAVLVTFEPSEVAYGLFDTVRIWAKMCIEDAATSTIDYDMVWYGHAIQTATGEPVDYIKTKTPTPTDIDTLCSADTGTGGEWAYADLTSADLTGVNRQYLTPYGFQFPEAYSQFGLKAGVMINTITSVGGTETVRIQEIRLELLYKGALLKDDTTVGYEQSSAIFNSYRHFWDSIDNMTHPIQLEVEDTTFTDYFAPKERNVAGRDYDIEIFPYRNDLYNYPSTSKIIDGPTFVFDLVDSNVSIHNIDDDEDGNIEWRGLNFQIGDNSEEVASLFFFETDNVASEIRINRCVLDGNDNQSTGAYRGIYINGLKTRYYIHDNFIYDWRNGIYMDNQSSNVNIWHNTIYSNSYAGINCVTSGGRIHNNLLDANTTAALYLCDTSATGKGNVCNDTTCEDADLAATATSSDVDPTEQVDGEYNIDACYDTGCPCCGADDTACLIDDCTTSYISQTTTATRYGYFEVGQDFEYDKLLMANETINKVVVEVQFYRNQGDPGDCLYDIFVNNGTAAYYDSQTYSKTWTGEGGDWYNLAGGSWETKTWEMTTNPLSGTGWTWTDISTLEVGIGIERVSPAYCRVDNLSVEITTNRGTNYPSKSSIGFVNTSTRDLRLASGTNDAVDTGQYTTTADLLPSYASGSKAFHFLKHFDFFGSTRRYNAYDVGAHERADNKTFYVRDDATDDTDTGEASDVGTAWKTLSKVSTELWRGGIASGDTVKFFEGDTWLVSDATPYPNNSQSILTKYNGGSEENGRITFTYHDADSSTTPNPMPLFKGGVETIVASNDYWTLSSHTDPQCEKADGSSGLYYLNSTAISALGIDIMQIGGPPYATPVDDLHVPYNYCMDDPITVFDMSESLVDGDFYDSYSGGTNNIIGQCFSLTNEEYIYQIKLWMKRSTLSEDDSLNNVKLILYEAQGSPGSLTPNTTELLAYGFHVPQENLITTAEWVLFTFDDAPHVPNGGDDYCIVVWNDGADASHYVSTGYDDDSVNTSVGNRVTKVGAGSYTAETDDVVYKLYTSDCEDIHADGDGSFTFWHHSYAGSNTAEVPGNPTCPEGDGWGECSEDSSACDEQSDCTGTCDGIEYGPYKHDYIVMDYPSDWTTSCPNDDSLTYDTIYICSPHGDPDSVFSSLVVNQTYYDWGYGEDTTPFAIENGIWVSNAPLVEVNSIRTEGFSTGFAFMNAPYFYLHDVEAFYNGDGVGCGTYTAFSGINAYGKNSSDGVVIHDSTFFGNAGSGIANSYGDNIEHIYNNESAYNQLYGILINGHLGHTLIEDNDFHHNATQRYAQPQWSYWNSEEVKQTHKYFSIYRYNLFRDCIGSDFKIYAGGGGDAGGINPRANNTVVYYNMAYNNSGHGIGGGSMDVDGQHYGLRFWNNLAYFNVRHGLAMDFVGGFKTCWGKKTFRKGQGCFYNEIYNNIIISGQGGYVLWDGSGIGNDYNDTWFYQANDASQLRDWFWYVGSPLTFAEFDSTADVVGCAWEDPDIGNIENQEYQLLGTSGCIDEATNLSSRLTALQTDLQPLYGWTFPYEDYYGQTVPNGLGADSGVHEFYIRLMPIIKSLMQRRGKANDLF